MKRKFADKLPNLPTLVRGTLEIADKALASLETYTKWIVTVVHSVCGRGPEIQTWMPNKVADSNYWDSYGLELASRVLNTGDPSHKSEIDAIVRAVQGTKTDTHGAFITNQCGLHVHVEAPQDLDILKQLALLLIVYEEEISKLHPPCRRPGHEATIHTLDSNRLAFVYP